MEHLWLQTRLCLQNSVFEASSSSNFTTGWSLCCEHCGLDVSAALGILDIFAFVQTTASRCDLGETRHENWFNHRDLVDDLTRNVSGGSSRC